MKMLFVLLLLGMLGLVPNAPQPERGYSRGACVVVIIDPGVGEYMDPQTVVMP
jgi:hypothetical protein